jgi:hypothetical protein
MVKNVSKDNIVSLAPMECNAACTATGLKIAGFNFHLFLTDYWGMRYGNGVLLSGKPTYQSNIDYIYGTESGVLANCAFEDMIYHLSNNVILCMECKVSEFEYFPKQHMTLLYHDFNHTILIVQYNSNNEKFLIVDPIFKYIGELTYEELYNASATDGSIHLITIALPGKMTSNLPTYRQVFEQSVERNYNYFIDGILEADIHAEGFSAIDFFKNDLLDSIKWDVDRRKSWIGVNNITLLTVATMRIIVWESFKSLNLMRPVDVENGQTKVDLIAKKWRHINVLLVRYSINSDNKEIEKIITLLEEVKSLEHDFLLYMLKIPKLQFV